jgi:hypothetical protein
VGLKGRQLRRSFGSEQNSGSDISRITQFARCIQKCTFRFDFLTTVKYMQFLRMDVGYKKEKELPLSGRRLHPSLDINRCRYSETDEASVRCNLFTL